MSQRAVESILGRLITDEEFRKEFFREPIETCRNNNWGVTPAELSALLGLDSEMLHEMAGALDPKIVRAIATDAMADAKTSISHDGSGAAKPSEPQTATRRH